jgi:sucrose phosphorylase
MIDLRKNIHELISFLYDQDQVSDLINSLWKRIEAFKQKHSQFQTRLLSFRPLSEEDVILIVYGDQFLEMHRSPLQSLDRFLKSNLQDVIKNIHILPFYPYSSDDGFSVIDYRQVAPRLGTWQDIALVGENHTLMFDLVANHISARSEWFQNFLAGKEPYTDYFPVIDSDTDLSLVVRPRATPVLTPFQTANGRLQVWTTFSEDQIDLDYSNPRVLLEMVDILLFYVAQGAQIIRLDAIAYLWKIPGTSCIHLPQTHAVVKLIRAILDIVAPSVLLITETNVPHEENISYFGDYIPELQHGNEAQLVYQFPLAPLILHTFLAEDSTPLTAWVDRLPDLCPGTTFLNFTASHDGIGIRPLEGLLPSDQIKALVDNTLNHGGQISYKSNPDGSQSVYELNITWYDALNDPNIMDLEMDISRFLASQAIMISLAGVPAVYVHSLFGSRNCINCQTETGRSRSINREKFILAELENELSDPHTLRSRIFEGYRHLLQIRKKQPAFHPESQQSVLRLDTNVFAIMRGDDEKGRLLCITNVTSKSTEMEIKLSDLGVPENTEWVDLVKGITIFAQNVLQVPLAPYQYRWLKLIA